MPTPPTLQTPRLLLTPVLDLAQLEGLDLDPDLVAALPALAETMENEPDAWWVWLITLDGAFIGDIGLRLVSGQRRELGYAINPAHRRRGYGLESVRAVIAHAFFLGVPRVVAATKKNTPSERLLQRAGFVPGLIRDSGTVWELSAR